jgi:hypothetical protein
LLRDIPFLGPILSILITVCTCHTVVRSLRETIGLEHTTLEVEYEDENCFIEET